MSNYKVSFWGILLVIILFVTSIILFMNGCIPDLPGTCPSYDYTHGILTTFSVKNITETSQNIYGMFKRNDNGHECKTLLYEHQPSPIILSNLTTYYDYSIGSKHEIFVSKRHETYCRLDFTDQAYLNTISGLVLLIMVGICCIVPILFNKHEAKILPF